MAQKKVYDKEFKIQAVKLGREIGFSKAAKELGVNIDTLYGWNKRAKDARLDLGPGTQTPDTAMSLTEEVQNKYRDVCFPITKEFREKVNNAVLETYQQAKEQAIQEGQERASQQMQTDDRGFMKVSGEPLPFR